MGNNYVFQGVLSSAIDWKCLEDQLENNRAYRDEIAKILDISFDVSFFIHYILCINPGFTRLQLTFG